jgi:hypothetical protein
MKLHEQILASRSKSQVNKLVKWVGRSQQRFDELMNIFLHDRNPALHRAGWALSNCVEHHPHLVSRHIRKLLKNLQQGDHHPSTRRYIVKMVQDGAIPKPLHGLVMDQCIRCVESPSEAIAVKAYAWTVLEKLLPLYPEIAGELKTIIDERWPHESAAVRVRAKRVLTKVSGHRLPGL